MTPNQKAALERLIKITEGKSGQCATVADFLLAGGTPRTAAGSIWLIFGPSILPSQQI